MRQINSSSIMFVLSLFLLTAMSFSIVSADVVIGACNSQSVCGISPPQSEFGFGAVEICGECYSCGVADGVCPEDFSDGTVRGNCANCVDPDCSVTISGRIHPVGKDAGIVDLELYAHYVSDPYNDYGDGPVATTGVNGAFRARIPSGNVVLVVKDDVWENELITRTFVRGTTYNNVDIEVKEGVCNSDCTGTFGDYCKKSCNGVNNCTYYDAYKDEPLILVPKDAGNEIPEPPEVLMTATEIASLCDYVKKGNKIYLSQDELYKYNYICCNQGTVKVKKDSILNTANILMDNIKDLRSTSIPVTLNGQVYNLVINVWSKK